MIIFRNKNKYLLDKIEDRNHTVSTLTIQLSSGECGLGRTWRTGSSLWEISLLVVCLFTQIRHSWYVAPFTKSQIELWSSNDSEVRTEDFLDFATCPRKFYSWVSCKSLAKTYFELLRAKRKSFVSCTASSGLP